MSALDVTKRWISLTSIERSNDTPQMDQFFVDNVLKYTGLDLALFVEQIWK